MPRSARPLMADVRASCQRERQTADVRANPPRRRAAGVALTHPCARMGRPRRGALAHARRPARPAPAAPPAQAPGCASAPCLWPGAKRGLRPEPRILTRIDEFFAGQAAPTTDFRVADFRDSDHHVLVVVEESC